MDRCSREIKLLFIIGKNIHIGDNVFIIVGGVPAKVIKKINVNLDDEHIVKDLKRPRKHLVM